MKKLISVILVAFLLGIACFMSGCGLFDALTNTVPTTYQNSEKYTAGNTEFEGTVDSLNIWWLDGSVIVKTHKENTVKIEESANQTLADSFRLHWRYYDASDYGDVLNIHYSASGKFDFGELKKDITVYLPENDGMDISLTIDAASVDIDTSGFENTLKELAVNTNSGKVSAKIDSADEVRISGQNDEGIPEENREFFFRANGTVYDLGVNSSYAKVDVAAKTVRSGEVGSVFADLIFSADEVRDLKLRNSRNKIYSKVLDFDSIDIETYEAPCELTLSPDASFALTIKEKDRFSHKMSPKNLSVEFEDVTQNGAQYTVGTGEKKLTVATDSDLRILPLEREEETPSHSFLSQQVKDRWKPQLSALLTKLEPVEKGEIVIGGFAVGLLDINFDSTPEVLAAYPGGSMGNVFLEIYDLQSGEQIGSYNAPHQDSWDTVSLCVAEENGELFLLSEGSFRNSDLGMIKLVLSLSKEISSDRELKGHTLFAESESGDVAYYQCDGATVAQAEYNTRYQAFWEKCHRIDETKLRLIKWETLTEENGEALAEEMAKALLSTSQKFLDTAK